MGRIEQQLKDDTCTVHQSLILLRLQKAVFVLTL